MIDYTQWDSAQEFDIELAAKLWFASVNNVDITEAPAEELNPYYHRLIAGIRNDQLKIEDAHLVLAEKGRVILTRPNLMKFFNASAQSNPVFLLPPEYRWLHHEVSQLKTWLVKALMEGKLNDNFGPKYWVAYLIEKLWFNFRRA